MYEETLSEGEFKSSWPCSIQNIAEFNEIENSSPYSGKSGHTAHEAKLRRCRQFPMIILSFGKTGGCRRIPYIGSERKNSMRKTGERYKHREEKSGSVTLRPVKNSPLYPAYGALQPHTRVQTQVPGQWVGNPCAVPRRHHSVGQMSPGRIQLFWLLNDLHFMLRKFPRGETQFTNFGTCCA